MSRDAASTLVFGPAYLDRIIRVDQPLIDPALGLPPIDRSVDGSWLDARPDGLVHLVDSVGASITIKPPPGWPGPVGTVAVSRGSIGPGRRMVRGVATRDDLGGMGAGFASSLGGTLVGALGSEDDPDSRAVVALLDRAGIAHEPVRVEGHRADWTLLISSGGHGDKLAVGFRGCHANWTDLKPWFDRPCRLRVVAALPNRVVGQALGREGSSVIRAFFPNARNMLDRVDPLGEFAGRVDFLSCNRGEWDDLGDRAEALDSVAVVAVTDGPAGAWVRFRGEGGGSDEIRVPAFPRSDPIRDTNRAGEAFASAMLATLVDSGWTPGPTSSELVRVAATRGSAAAALVLGRADFGFATAREVDEAVRKGWVG